MTLLFPPPLDQMGIHLRDLKVLVSQVDVELQYRSEAQASSMRKGTVWGDP